MASYFLSLPADERPTAIFSSPYCPYSSHVANFCNKSLIIDRCLQTAKPTSEILNLPIHIEHGLYVHSHPACQIPPAHSHSRSEWFTPVRPSTGLHPRPASAQTLSKYFPTISTSYSSICYPTRTGETIEEIHERTAQFLEALIPLVSQSSGEHEVILLVSHAATVAALVRALVGDPELPVRVGCCSLSELHLNEEENTGVVGSWIAVKLVDGKHLVGGTLRDWGFEDVTISPGEASPFKFRLVSVGSLAGRPLMNLVNLLPERMTWMIPWGYRLDCCPRRSQVRWHCRLSVVVAYRAKHQMCAPFLLLSTE